MAEQFNKTQGIALRLMRVLEATPAANQRELAERSGMSLGSLNYCLKALMAKKVDLTRRFLSRKQQEYEVLRAEVDALNLEVNR